jgi:hypothetical protein
MLFLNPTPWPGVSLLQVQPPTKKAMAPAALYNGLGGKQLVLDSSALAASSQQQQQQTKTPAAAKQ